LVHKLKYLSESELRKFIYDSILLKKNIKSYQGVRHIYSLPVNGQRTRTNAKTMK
jgi:small subunit ribosomal protein S13